MILGCVAQAVTYLAKLSYQLINYHEIYVEILNTSSTKSPSCGRIEKIPVISFPIAGGWVNDPTIIFHEIGHAIWDLLFAYPPKHLDLNSPDIINTYLGIQEGFADYFAATFLTNDTSDCVCIGKKIPDPTIDHNNYSDALPRLIDGNPAALSDTLDPNERVYGLGRKWANLLWNLRQQIEPEEADKIIFLAHFKPFAGEHQFQDPIKSYFESLKQAAKRLEINFTGWDQLEVNHKI